MTDRLYYRDSFLDDFDAEVREVLLSPRPALILDCTAFYPTSGGQIFDTARSVRMRVPNSGSSKWPTPKTAEWCIIWKRRPGI